MRRNIVNERQPFGEVHKSNMHPSTIGNFNGKKNMPGSTSVVMNHGVEQPQSNADKAPGAHEAACRNANNPFAYVGHSFKSAPTMVGMYYLPI